MESSDAVQDIDRLPHGGEVAQESTVARTALNRAAETAVPLAREFLRAGAEDDPVPWSEEEGFVRRVGGDRFERRNNRATHCGSFAGEDERDGGVGGLSCGIVGRCEGAMELSRLVSAWASGEEDEQLGPC